MKKLEILVPQYKETEDVLKPLLRSIEIQQNVNMDDIGVIICNDGSDVFLSDEFLNGFDFGITYIKNEHKGVSATRNACLDASTAEYVMFCDADDMFSHVCGLFLVFREMKIGFDALISVFMEETRIPDTNEVDYINREQDATFVHGKIFRRQYLIDKKIRWNDRLTVHEDSYFNILAQSLSQNVKYCPMPFYLWKWRDESVCRHDPKYILKTYNNMLDSNDALIDEFLKRGDMNTAAFYVAFMTFDAYYLMNKPEWINLENVEYRRMTEKRFQEYYAKHKSLWNIPTAQEKVQISNGVRSRSVIEGMMMEAITIDDWLKRIEEME